MFSLTLPWLFALASLIFISLLIRYIYFPYKRINSYKREGIVTFFFPLIGILYSNIKNLKTNHDQGLLARQFTRDFPNQKVLVTNLGTSPVFTLRDPQYIKEFLQKPHLYHKHALIAFYKPLLGNGLVTSEGELWKTHRKIISASFHYEFLKSNIEIIQETTKELIEKFTPEDYKSFQSIIKIQEITGEIVGRIFFGKNLSNYAVDGKPLTAELGDIVIHMAYLATSPLTILFGFKFQNMTIIPKYKKTLQRIKNFRRVCFNIIQDRKANPVKTNDFLGILLALQAEGSEQKLSDEDIVDEFITFFLAGMDTTGHLCAMVLYCLAQHPGYNKELAEERKKTYNQEKIVTADTLQKMDVLHSVLKEVLRFYPPLLGPVYRTAIEDHKLLDLDIRKGDALKVESLSVYFDENHFPDAQKFDPERWRQQNPKADPFAFIPFSAGPRNCIGQHMAIVEAKIIMSELLERFNFKLHEGYRLTMAERTLYEPINDILYELTPK